MESSRAKVQCADCGDWIEVETDNETVTCDCGQRFAVTVTPIPTPLA